MASIESWVGTRTFAFIHDPVMAGVVYGKLEADPVEVLTAEESAWGRSLEDALREATWILNALMSGKLHPEQCWIDDYVLHGCNLVLRQGPVNVVARVEALSLCSQDAPVLLDSTYQWCWRGDNRVSFCCSTDIYKRLCGCKDDAVRVYYQTKSNLPPGTEARIIWLAQQYLLASTGQACSLPERVTSITRQGVSWTMLDPMDFLGVGLTGVGRIDTWLSAARREHPSASMYDPYLSDRLRARTVSCVTGEAFNQSAFTDAPFA